ncbi:helicase-associated domain-containing protein [Arthrobacter agilis]|uniref:helicase-associated domain-containing protein n=1 Tax=Arthrobacter agilis TaxID=37921 RepID=UPI002366F3A7|nr:helicase-associated domain-containing protein [Arthrobacter agilis]WDF33840.1 helicase-associated domain-containing protein [Arthrobacter agilis]
MSAIRALADQLARRSDDDLRRLLSVRPDLILPAVPDFSALAARASTRVSLQRALDNATRPHLQVLEAVAILTDDDGLPVSRPRLLAALGATAAADADRIVEDLVGKALVVESEDGILPVGALTDALGPYPAGLGRSFRTLARSIPRYGPALITAVPLVAPAARTEALTSAAAAGLVDAVAADADAWDRVLAEAPDGVQGLLDRLRETPVGTTATGSDGGASPAVRWLLDRGLLAPLDALHVELPRGVGMALRGHAVFPTLALEPPVVVERTTRAALRDNAAFGAIAETLRLMTTLLGIVAAVPVATLRSGGVGVREVRRVREALQSSDAEAVWLLELAASVGLLALDPDDSRWKAARLQVWESLDRDAQWLLLVEGWLALDRAPALIGSRLPDGSAVNALAAEASRPDAPTVRRRLLQAAVHLTGPDAAPEALPVLADRSVVDLASWYQPRLQRRFARLLPGMLLEAAALGLTGGGSLTDAGRLVAGDQLEDAARHVREALPDPVAHVVLQADLTAVAPGYLQPEVARGLLRMATPEGQGPATTYRFSADSVRSALDAGEDAASILAFLTTHSATEVPQALTYLVEDTASRYGRLRLGRAGSYVRTDDDAVTAAVLADPRAAVLGVVQVAPTVLVSPASPQELTALLRDLGFTPAPDTPAGEGARTTSVRETGDAGTAARLPPDQLRSQPATWAVAEEEITAQLAVLRSARTGPTDRQIGSDGPLLGLETLRAAIRSHSSIRLGTADSEGNHVRQILVPLSVSGGRLRVFDPEKQVERVVSVHRVMDVEILEGSPADG